MGREPRERYEPHILAVDSVQRRHIRMGYHEEIRDEGLLVGFHFFTV